MRSSLLALGALIVSTSAAPSASHIQHEKRSFLPPGWEKHERIPGHEVIPMRFALAQQNLHKADQYLMDVSSPDSPNYGKHWTAKQIAEAFAPSEESVDAVTAWLKSSGIDPVRIQKSQSLGWLALNATILEAEDLLKTRYYLHKHDTGKAHVGCSDYYVPAHVRPHIDFITPTLHFDTKIPHAQPMQKLNMEEVQYEKRADSPAGAASSTAAVGRPVQTKAAVNVLKTPTNGFKPKKGPNINVQKINMELQNCNTMIVPDCLRSLYHFPSNFFANPRNSFGCVNYLRS